MGFIPIISCFSPWQLGVSTLVGANASSISKWWDNYPLIPRIGYVLLKLYHKWVGCFPCNHKNNHFMISWHKCKATAIRCIPDFIGFFSFEVDYFLLHLGLIPISWCFHPRQLGFSTYVGATASSISKWWDIHPTIHGIGYVNLRLYHLQVGCFLCNHKNNHIWSLMDPFLLIAVWFIPDFIGILSFEVVNSLKQNGLIPVSWKFLPRQLGISTLVGATASSISKWWDIYPSIHWIGYVNLRLYHNWVGCFPCSHKNNHFGTLQSLWFYQNFNANRSIPVIIGFLVFDVEFGGFILNFLRINLQGYFWNTFIKKGIDGLHVVGLIPKEKVRNLDFFNLEDCGIFALMSYLFARGWDFIQGHFWNSWIIILEDLLKSNWLSLGKKEVEDNLKMIWKWWDLLGNNGFSIILSWGLKILYWSLLDFKVKIGKKFNNYIVEKIGKNCKKSIVQSSKLIAIIGFSLVWRYLQTIDDLNELANDSLDLEVPWKHWKSNIFQTLDYLFEYEAIFWSLTWWKIGSYMKIEDFEDFGVPPDLEPDVIMRKKGKNAKLKNKLKSILDNESNQLNDPLKAKSVTTLVNKFESEANLIDRKNSSELKVEATADKIDNSGNEIAKPSNGSEVDAMAPLIGSIGEKEAMMVFWNGLTLSEKEGFVHGLRFIKKKYNKEGEFDSSYDDSIDNVKKLSSVSQRNDILMNWKDLNQKKKEKVIHKLCTSKIKKQVEANLRKNQVPFKPSASLFPAVIDMKKTSDFEASDGLQKVGETVLNLIPEGVPISNNNSPVIVDLQDICSMRSQVKEKKVKKKFEIDEMVSQQLEQVCNEIIYHFPSKFNHLELANEGEFKYKYVDTDEEESEGQMNIDDKEEIRTTGYNTNGGLLITEDMLEEVKASNVKGKEEKIIPVQNSMEEKIEGKVSYAEKVSGKKMNAANLISKVKKNAELPEGVVEMPISDILKGCSPFKTTLYGSEQGLLSVLEGGVWMIFDSALIIRRWTTGVSSVKDQHDKIPVWVKIYNVPLEYWNGTGLSHIAWEIGKPLDVDAHTAKMCQEHWGRPDFMRILIEMSAAKEWLKEVLIYSRI
ncbi:unnamed protein product [Lactuca saligna]|uniref:DUF4283 domain-containing protein n=1 Tax=Lactuca saligna TaxID=75948 RepID=A0AA35ZA26_LACSI|nr:unnamed protein product [Lactuca saligna]